LHIFVIMKKTLLTIAFSLLSLAMFAQGKYDSLYANLPVSLDIPSTPSIPDFRVGIEEYGAVGDGVTLCTGAFSSAIEQLSKAGGGHLDVPRGVWLTGPIVLKSKIDLHLSEGAMVVFTPDKNAYLTDASKGRAVPCISAQNCSDISITGSGVLDGNGKYWRYSKREKLSDVEWKELKQFGGQASEDGKFWFPADLDESARQHMIILKRCKKVLLQGVTIQNSPKFHINPSQCQDVVLDGLLVRCPWNAQNGDGIDVGNCKRVLVTDCTVDVGDDGICMKGGSGENGVKAGPCSDILICGNTVFHAHGGFVIGSDVSGGMKRIVVKDCVFSGTDTGLRFKSAMGRGGHCEDIFISDIVMNDIRDAAVTFSCDYANVTYVNLSENDDKRAFAPDFAGIDITRVICRECSVAVYAHGIKGLDCIHDVTLSESSFVYRDKAQDIDKETATLNMESVRFFPLSSTSGS